MIFMPVLVRIERLLKEIGWKKQPDKCSDDFKLKWVEVKSAINYDSFREGQHCNCVQSSTIDRHCMQVWSVADEPAWRTASRPWCWTQRWTPSANGAI